MKREKPMMGTKLVPSIENMEGCYKWGGKWDRKNRLCIGGYDCTAPIKGLEVCWRAFETEIPEGDADGNEVWVQKFEPCVTATIYNSDIYIHDSMEGIDDFEWYDDEDEAYQEAKSFAMSLASDIKDLDRTGSYLDYKCFTPRGRQISCDEPNAVAAHDPSDVIRAFRKEKPLLNDEEEEGGFRWQDKRINTPPAEQKETKGSFISFPSSADRRKHPRLYFEANVRKFKVLK